MYVYGCVPVSVVVGLCFYVCVCRLAFLFVRVYVYVCSYLCDDVCGK